MRRNAVISICLMSFCLWSMLSYSAWKRSKKKDFYKEIWEKFQLDERISNLQESIAEQKQLEDSLHSDLVKMFRHNDSLLDTKRADETIVIPVLLFACNRVSVKRSLDQLIRYRPSKTRFPIIVSQDCGHQETANILRSYDNDIIFLQQPDLSEVDVSAADTKFKGYYKIARHYGWALRQVFNERKYKAVIIVEDDLDVSVDFFEYFLGTYPILASDPSLWCVSAWNDNGKSGLIDENAADLLYRSDFFPGLGWMMTSDIWEELDSKWPKSFWDDWMRLPEQRKERACVRPEISRTRTFGKKGVSNGLFFDHHLKFIKLNEQSVGFTKKDLSYLIKEAYDEEFLRKVNEAPVVTTSDVLAKKVSSSSPVRLLYRSKTTFLKLSKLFGLMTDFRSGVPRTAYKGVVSFFTNGVRVFVAPSFSWKGYDTTW